MGTTNYNRLTPVSYQIATATSATSAGITLPTRGTGQTDPDYAVIVAETAAIRWRDDPLANGTVNGTSGSPLATGQYMEYDGNLTTVRFAAQTGTASVHITLYRTH